MAVCRRTKFARLPVDSFLGGHTGASAGAANLATVLPARLRAHLDPAPTMMFTGG